jgi:hypothetical protein
MMNLGETSLFVSMFFLVLDQRHIPQAIGPRGLQARHLPVDRAIRLMCAGQVSGGHQKFLDDLPAGEGERFLQDLNAITTRKVSYFQQKSCSNRQVEIISNTKADAWQPRLRKLGNPAHEHQESTYSAYEKFLHDLPARKHEVPLEQRSPVFQG